jgi:hypothetical protein
MSLVTSLKSDVYHLLRMRHVYIEVTITFLALENLTLNFFERLNFWDIGGIEISQGQQIYIYTPTCFGSLPQQIFQSYSFDKFSIHSHFFP